MSSGYSSLRERMMYQIYFLSIVFNIFAGITLAHEHLSENSTFTSVFNPDFFKRLNLWIILGIVTFIVGFLKILSVSPGDVKVVGDLIPALAGMIMGFTLVLGYYRDKSSVRSDAVERMDNLLLSNKTTLGVIGMISAVLHFFLHSVLFL